jgi:hypothetical protein
MQPAMRALHQDDPPPDGRDAGKLPAGRLLRQRQQRLIDATRASAFKENRKWPGQSPAIRISVTHFSSAPWRAA